MAVMTKEILALSVEIGDALLRNGAEVYRVEDTVVHILEAYEVENYDVYVLSNGIFASANEHKDDACSMVRHIPLGSIHLDVHILEAYEVENYDVYVLSNGIFASANEHKDDACSMVRHIPLGSIHLERIAALNQLSREICSHECSLIDAWHRLEECKSIPYSPKLTQLFFCGLGCGCFSYLFGGAVLDAVMSFFIGMLLQLFRSSFNRKKTSKFIINILGSALVTLLALTFLHLGAPTHYDKVIIGGIMPLVPGIAFTTSIRINILGSALVTLLALTFLHLGAPTHYDKVIIGGIMPLVPGIAFTTSIRDFFNGDYLSGAIHMIDAILTAFCIAVGVGTVITVFRFLLGGAFLA